MKALYLGLKVSVCSIKHQFNSNPLGLPSMNLDLSGNLCKFPKTKPVLASTRETFHDLILEKTMNSRHQDHFRRIVGMQYAVGMIPPQGKPSVWLRFGINESLNACAPCCPKNLILLLTSENLSQCDFQNPCTIKT